MRVVVAVLTVLVLGMSARGEQAQVREDLELRAFLLEDLFKTHAKTNETCYVAFAQFSAGKTGTTRKVNPPAGFLKRFEGRPYGVKPATAYPKPVAHEPFPPDNPRIDAPDGIYTVRILDWIDANTARVAAQMWRNGLWARGYDAVAEKKDGKWRIKKYGESWVS